MEGFNDPIFDTSSLMAFLIWSAKKIASTTGEPGFYGEFLFEDSTTAS